MAKKFTNTLYTGDNLYIMHGMNSESVDLIYLDPPFSRKRTYSAPIGSKAAGISFKNMWTWQDVDMAYLEKVYDDYPNMFHFINVVGSIHGKALASYLCFMLQRLIEMHRILKPTGSFYLHVDPATSHYLKIICDRIFGKNNFRNEIVWNYSQSARGAKAKASKFGGNHDIILAYSKGKKRTHNKIEVPFYHSIDKLPSYIRYNKFAKVAFKTSPRGDYTDKSIKQLENKGRIHITRSGSVRIKYFLVVENGYVVEPKTTGDTWLDIPDMMHSPQNERTGYPTQKPLALLHRIIKASSNEGGIVFDPFCGCATAMVASHELNRKWIGIDIEERAGELISSRLKDDAGLFTDFVQTSSIPIRTDVKIEKRAEKHIREDLYKEQDSKCNGCKRSLDIQDFHKDHIIPKSKGGQDTYSNYQLLCMTCNSMKGDKPMEYLIVKLNEMQKARLKYSF